MGEAGMSEKVALISGPWLAELRAKVDREVAQGFTCCCDVLGLTYAQLIALLDIAEAAEANCKAAPISRQLERLRVEAASTDAEIAEVIRMIAKVLADVERVQRRLGRLGRYGR